MKSEPPITPKGPALRGKGWTLRRLDDAPLEATICGTRRRLLSDGDEVSAFAHVVRIREATAHFHKVAAELYYVLEGSGVLTLDGQDVPLRPGTCVEVQPGVVHAARGDVLVLVVGIPSIRDDDTYLPGS